MGAADVALVRQRIALYGGMSDAAALLALLAAECAGWIGSQLLVGFDQPHGPE